MSTVAPRIVVISNRSARFRRTVVVLDSVSWGLSGILSIGVRSASLLPALLGRALLREGAAPQAKRREEPHTAAARHQRAERLRQTVKVISVHTSVLTGCGGRSIPSTVA